MKKHHYVYHSFEEWGRDYIGIRSCDCLPEEDTRYFGSFYDKTFNPTGKTILFVCETREEVLEIEIELHDFFDVAVNPQFANKTKATSTGFDMTGVVRGSMAEEHKKKISVAKTGKTLTEETKKKISVGMSGENNPMFGMSGENSPKFGVPCTEAQKKAQSEKMSGEKNPSYGKTGALNPRSKAIIAIKPDGTQRHFDSGREAARELGMDQSTLRRYLKPGYVPKQRKFKEWQFLFKNSEDS